MTADVKKKRDKNNFINIILNKISLVRNFKQKINLSITTKRILNCATCKFYLRKRRYGLFLYTRLIGKFGSIKKRHIFIKDICNLIPNLKPETTKGHYTGFELKVDNDNNTDLILFLKLLSLLSNPNSFYKKENKTYILFYNYINSSQIPIHLKFTRKQLQELNCEDLHLYLTKEIKSPNDKYM